MSNEKQVNHRQALEDAFFQKRGQELMEYLRTAAQERATRDRLQEISGIDDPRVLETLERAGITPESMTALTLLPLARVAWADAKVHGAELESLLSAAHEQGLSRESPGYQLLDKWLTERPSAEMLDAWWNYARSLTQELNAADLDVVRQSTLGRARRIAEASGGFLGLGNKISENERLVLEDLERAFEEPTELL